MHEPNWDNSPFFTYTLTYGHTDVVVKASAESAEAICQLLADPPSNELYSALEFAQRQYYPDSAFHPWKEHKEHLAGPAHADKRAELSIRPWPLAWYWKALLPALHRWDDSCSGRWRIAIRQIRQWVMVLIYEYARQEARLLRPPLFGPSQRLLQNDQYWVLSAFDKTYHTISREWRAAQNLSDYERAHVLGRHDVIYRLDKVKFASVKDARGNPGSELSVTLSCAVVLDPHKTKKEKLPPSITSMLTLPGSEEELRKEDIEGPYPLLVIPTFRKDKQTSDELPLLLSSDQVCRALVSLSEVWNDPTVKSVLIHAPPGSGKELLAQSIYDLREFEGQYVSFAMSPDPALAEYNQRMLYFRDMDDAEVAGEVVTMIREETAPNAQMEHSISDGLVFKARKGVLFLDEIDKDKEGKTRTSLLRLLESDEFAVHGTTLVVKIPKSQLPTYVFAASHKTLAEVMKLEPPDFWTRISHFVEMQHPLKGTSPVELKQILADYFHMFWNQHVPKFFKESNLLPSSFLERKRDVEAAPFLHKYCVGLFWTLMDANVKRRLASNFASQMLANRDVEKISVRNIRSVVGRVVFSLVHLLLYDKDFDKPLARIRKRLARMPAKEAKWIEKDWSRMLAQIIAADVFEPEDKDLFQQVTDIESRAGIAELCEDINVEIERLEIEMREIIDDAIRTIPSVGKEFSTMTRRVLLLPGMSSPANARYFQVYHAIQSEAARRRWPCMLVLYPGQRGEDDTDDEVLSYASALDEAKKVAERFRPNWLIGRSFGCTIAAGLLASTPSWLSDCDGAVFWGPSLGSSMRARFADEQTRLRVISELRTQHHTRVTEDFLETSPGIEDLISSVPCAVRVARGSEDYDVTLDHMHRLKTLHGADQHDKASEVVEIEGLKHSVLPQEVSQEHLNQYFAVLFDDIEA